mmetsp:Transcript_39329/g.126226  ORF Transcript_39329/g.126226 Transcript_39329/m.126226 type:complete len:223 (-) Transcript_39329:36-704(-)
MFSSVRAVWLTQGDNLSNAASSAYCTWYEAMLTIEALLARCRARSGQILGRRLGDELKRRRDPHDCPPALPAAPPSACRASARCPPQAAPRWPPRRGRPKRSWRGSRPTARRSPSPRRASPGRPAQYPGIQQTTPPKWCSSPLRPSPRSAAAAAAAAAAARSLRRSARRSRPWSVRRPPRCGVCARASRLPAAPPPSPMPSMLAGQAPATPKAPCGPPCPLL